MESGSLLTFSIVAPTATPYVIILAFVGFLFLLAALFGYMMVRARSISFHVEDAGLRIKAMFYGRKIPRESLDVANARVVDLTADAELKLWRRTNGMGFPGLKTGWYKLKSGDKALVFVTDLEKVLLIPTTEDYTLFLSVDEPQELIEALS